MMPLRSTASISSSSSSAEVLRAVPRLGSPAAAARTDVGLMRERNEDAFACLPELGLFVVADGVGGVRGGEVASRLAIETIQRAFERPDPTWPEAEALADGDGRPLLAAAIQRANARIFAAAKLDPTRDHMSTTIAGVYVGDGHVVVAHVGDSRVYRYRDGKLQRLTDDHTMFAEGVRAGKFSQNAAAARSSLRHVLTRAVGSGPTVEVDTRVEAPRPGDVLLLCSDGLSTVVHNWEITAILASYPDLDEAAAQLVECANDSGGPDNVTCVLVRLPS